MMTEDELDKAESYWTSQEKDAKKMPAEVLREKAEAFLTSHNTCALACGAGDFVRCTPLEYVWRDGAIWIFTEGGLKFHALRKNLRVSLAVFEPYAGFGKLASIQVTGTAEIVDPESAEYAAAAAAKGIPQEMLERVRTRLHLLKIEPSHMDLLMSGLHDEGLSPRQSLDC
ncbi:MAG: pyridoxamine 5'-phosphate oxidase family protein [Atopobiaceae bacterium]|jgi:nitroimidazol reductase NimA-like FMN-containing flavoprotein (pyridoxamine 5'-phosphate oxidase superfamily)|nr:pyridoxamine 5'-phosphate oxidase family protein [Atopobiaceae bacterium]